jgi:glutaredoxin
MNRTCTIALLAAALAGAFCLPAAAQYRWTDANGKVHYGDLPPADAKDLRSLGVRSAPAAAAADANAGLPFELRRALERAPVVLYTAPDCQPCVPAAALLRERGVPYAERSVTTNEDLQEFRRITGGLRLPHVTVGTLSQNGFSPETWNSLLDAAGYPKGSMLPRNYQWAAPQPLVPPAKVEPKAADAAAAASAAAAPAKAAR